MIKSALVCEICNSRKERQSVSLICNACEYTSLTDTSKGCMVEISNMSSIWQLEKGEINVDAFYAISTALSQLCNHLTLNDFFEEEILPKFIPIMRLHNL